MKILLSTAAATLLFPDTALAQVVAPAATPDPKQSAATESPGQSASTQPRGTDAAPIGDIVVTAQRRSQNLRDVPLSISAVSGDTLQARQVVNIQGLTETVPNVVFNVSLGQARIAIRGIGADAVNTGSEARTAYHLDGVYVSRPSAAAATFFDVDRVEVLRGPQGTLYGRNATAGAVNVITRDPGSRLDGYGEVTFGNYQSVRLEGALGGPLAEGVSARASFQVTRRDGYGHNLINGLDVDNENSEAARLKLKLALGPAASLVLSGDYFHEDDNAYGYHLLGSGSPTVVTTGIRLGGSAPSPTSFDMTSDAGPTDYRRFYGFSGTLTWDLGGVNLTSVTGYRNSRTDLVTDLDGTSLPLTVFEQYEQSRQVSQELRLQGAIGPVKWLLGGYLFDEKVYGFNSIIEDRRLVGGPAGLAQGYKAGGNLDTRAYAAFAQVDYQVVPKLTVTAGGRYSYERKAVDEFVSNDFVRNYSPSNPVIPLAAQQARHSWRDFSPKVTVKYDLASKANVYATWSRGFKSGGYNLGGVQHPFDPERLTDYEVGFKADWLQGRLRTNLSAFYYDYSNLQVSRVIVNAVAVENAAKATIKGLEAEATAVPVDGLTLNASLSLLDTKYKEFTTYDQSRPALGLINLAGNDLTQAPIYTVSASVQKDFATSIGNISLRGEGYWVDRVYFSAFNLAAVSQPAYSRYNASLRWTSPNGQLSATLFGRNLTNNFARASEAVGTGLVGFPLVGTFLPPRTFGVQLATKF